jgi:hypothetical protein
MPTASSWRLSCQIDENGSNAAGAAYLDGRFAVVERHSGETAQEYQAITQALRRIEGR